MDFKKEMINKKDKISIVQQCEILELTRSSVYYEPQPEFSDKDLSAMQLIYELFEERPNKGHRSLWQDLIGSEIPIGRDKTLNYMKHMGLKPIYPKKKTSIANKEHKKYPYLLRDLKIEYANQVWSTDITYLKLPQGTCYLVAIIDWFSRKTLSWRISNTMDVAFCKDVLNEAIAKYGAPEIFNSDQGSQFTCLEFISILEKYNIKISMDSVGRWADNIIIERFWRTLKYEDFYIRKYKNLQDLKIGIEDYMQYYNSQRKHSSLAYWTPNDFYENSMKLAA